MWFSTYNSYIVPCWFQKTSQSIRIGQCASTVEILAYIEEIDKILIYADKIKQKLHICNVSYKTNE